MIEFKDGYRYFAKGILPLSKKQVNIDMPLTPERYQVLLDIHLQYYDRIFLKEWNMNTMLSTKVWEVVNTSRSSNMVIIRRTKRQHKIPLYGNLLVKEDSRHFYMYSMFKRKRVILKFDIADKPILEKLTKWKYHFIARYFKTTKQYYFILKGRKLRSNSIYRYLLGERNYSEVVHKDGDMFNFSRDNLIITGCMKKMAERTTVPLKTIFVEKTVDELVGFRRSSDRSSTNYIANTRIGTKEVKIGRFKDPYEAAMAYDLALAYYKGPVFTVNYPYEYYSTLKPDLVSKWFDNFSKRKVQPKTQLA